MVKVVTVVLNYNTVDLTLACLRTLAGLDTNGIEHTVVVVDNNSTDDSVSKIRSQWPEVRLIKNDRNAGYTGGNNLGYATALEYEPDYVMILNSDTELDAQLLQNLVRAAETDEARAIVSPKIYFAAGHEFHKDRYMKSDRGKVFWYAGGYFDWANVQSVHRGVDEVDTGQYDKGEQIVFASGCCMLVRCAAVEDADLFDEAYFMYFEDGDLCMRMRQKGQIIWYEPTAKLWHINAGSSGSGSDLHDYFISRNRMRFGMKFAPMRSKLALIKQSFNLLISGRSWQRMGIEDFYLQRWGGGRYPIEQWKN